MAGVRQVYEGYDPSRPERRDKEVQVVYEYRVNGVTYRTDVYLKGSYPATVKVYYNPKNPKKCVTSCDTTMLAKYKQGCLITIIATLGAMFLVVHGLKLFMN